MSGVLNISSRWPRKGTLAWRLLHPQQHSVKQGRRATAKDGPVRVLHVLSQQPGKTGSGVYLEALVHQASRAGLEQRVIVGMPADAPPPAILPLKESHVRPVRFGTPSLPFPVAGMSDVMPYESTRFSEFTPDMLESYLQAFHEVLARERDLFQPDIVHTHHLWIVTALARLLFPGLPVVTSCHGTELRQLALARSLSPFVIPGCARVDRVMALHEGHIDQISALYGIDRDRIVLTGAGYRDDIFHPPIACPCPPHSRDVLTVAYAGKISRAKGVPYLLEAMERIEVPGGRDLRLLIAGSAGGEEGIAIREIAKSQGDRVVFLGALPQEELAEVLKSADIFVLPSFYEGLPLVVLEAIACCCRVIVTDLPGMNSWLPEDLEQWGIIERVPLPRLTGPDVPESLDLPEFTAKLAGAITRQLRRCLTEETNWQGGILQCMEGTNWEGIFRKVLGVYNKLLGQDREGSPEVSR